jgi:hypothetical protein
MIELLGYVERHPIWTLVYLMFAWTPACWAIANFRFISINHVIAQPRSKETELDA